MLTVLLRGYPRVFESIRQDVQHACKFVTAIKAPSYSRVQVPPKMIRLAAGRKSMIEETAATWKTTLANITQHLSKNPICVTATRSLHRDACVRKSILASIGIPRRTFATVTTFRTFEGWCAHVTFYKGVSALSSALVSANNSVTKAVSVIESQV
jgi:hypothetical protein